MADLLILSAVGLLLWIVRVDVASLKITNKSILVLLCLYMGWATLTGFVAIWADVAAGATLFLLALVMWLLGTMGAGDVKLYAVIGAFVGFDHLLLYAILLLLVSVLFVIAIQVGGRITRSARLTEIRKTGRAPYSVPMCLAAIPAILLRTFG